MSGLNEKKRQQPVVAPIKGEKTLVDRLPR